MVVQCMLKFPISDNDILSPGRLWVCLLLLPPAVTLSPSPNGMGRHSTPLLYTNLLQKFVAAACQLEASLYESGMYVVG